MKILLASRYFLHPSRNGASQLTRRMAVALSSMGHEVRTACMGYNGQVIQSDDMKIPIHPVVQDNIHTYCFPPVEPPYCDGRPLAEFRSDPNRKQWAKTILEDWTPDVLHVTACGGFYDLMREAMERDIPTVATLLDFELLCPHQFLLKGDGSLCHGNPSPGKCRSCLKFNTSLSSRIACWGASFGLGRFVLQSLFGSERADTFDFHWAIQEVLHEQTWLREHMSRFIAPAPIARRIFEAHGVQSERIVDLVYSLPQEKLEKSPREVVPPGRERRLRIGFVGRPSWEKGFHIILNAFLALDISSSPPPELWLAGNGIDIKKVTEYASNPTLAQKNIKEGTIRLYNNLSDKELRGIAAKMDVCVIPSICYECTPLVLLESLAQETPCIASDTDGIRHMIVEGKSGRLFPPGNTSVLAQILQNLILNPEQLDDWKTQLPAVQSDAEYAQELTTLYKNLGISEHKDVT